MKSRILLFILAFFVWSVLCWAADWEHLLVGGLASFLVAFIAGDLFVNRPRLWLQPKRYFYFFFSYLPFFLWECLKANIDVAYRVLHPGRPINPGIVKVKTKLVTDTALTFLANSITLTPGTMSLDIDRENGVLYIHWIDVKAKDVTEASKIIVERFEQILKKVFE